MHRVWTYYRNRFLGGLAIWLVGILVFTPIALRTHATPEFAYAIDVNYRLNGNGETTVMTKYTVTNNTPNRILASLKVSTPTSEVKNLKAYYADGGAVPFSVVEKTSTQLGYSYKYQEIELKFNRSAGGQGARLLFSLSYDTTELLDIKGGGKTFYVPSLAQIGNDENYRISISVPKDFGRFYSTGALPTLSGADGELVRYSFDKISDLKRSIAITFGESTVFQADFVFPLNNDTGIEKIMTITLPPDTGTQKVFIKSLEPTPIRTRLDIDGNVLADYRVPARSSLTVKTDIAAKVSYLEYDLSKSGVRGEIPSELVRRYTSQTRYWQATQPDLMVKARQATAGTEKVIDIVRNLHSLTIDTLTYNNEKIKYNIRQGSAKALSNPDNAVCLEYSDLMIAFLRSQGIPARMPVGYAYAGNLKQSKSVTDSLHSWVEAFVPGIGWMHLDPTWGEKFDTFGKSDLDHFVFAMWGVDDSLPAAVMASGVDMGYQYENTVLTYAKDFPNSAVTGQATAHKYVLFPGISIIRYSVTAPENMAGDKYSVFLVQEGNQVSQELGSLAPRQEVNRTYFQLGNTFTATLELLFVQTLDGKTVPLAAQSSAPQYWPMYIIVSIIILIVIGFLLRWRHLRRKKRQDQAVLHTKRLQDALSVQQDPSLLTVESDYVEYAEIEKRSKQ
ncbi:transglutaminase family protein [Candidatus Saccharibacteria bacterium]|nr:transglutaminase family protein [Candidatus Saccharibacteria bacterium]